MNDLRELTKAFAMRGQLVEAGFIAFRQQMLDPKLPARDVEEIRRVYFAGAQHVLYLICKLLDDGNPEVTVDNCTCLDAIADELAAFAATRMETEGTA